MRKILMTLAAVLCCTMTTVMFSSCDKEEEGMNDGFAYYNYRAMTEDFDYSDAAGPFDTAIRFSVGMEPFMGGDDNKVLRACDAVYEELKKELRGRSGKVSIIKIRHPDGKQMILKEYEF
jgi:hypothetical protein